MVLRIWVLPVLFAVKMVCIYLVLEPSGSRETSSNTITYSNFIIPDLGTP